MNAIILAVTPLYAGILTLMYVGLAFYVIQGRKAKQIGLGTAGDDEMLTRIRIHGNFAEYVPFCLLVILLLELSGNPAWLLHALGASVVAGRVAHAYGLMKSPGVSVFRLVGMVATFMVLIAGGIAAVVAGLGAYS